jgi:hypothetical protein
VFFSDEDVYFAKSCITEVERAGRLLTAEQKFTEDDGIVLVEGEGAWLVQLHLNVHIVVIRQYVQFFHGPVDLGVHGAELVVYGVVAFVLFLVSGLD